MQRHRRPAALKVSFLTASIAAALLFAGCGGGDGTADETSTTLAPPPVTTVTTLPGKAFAELVGTELVASEDTPEDVRTGLEQHMPMVVAFFVTGGTDDSVVLGELDELAVQYSDVDFYKYDYKTPAAYGDLAVQLQVDYPPQVAFIDSNGVIQGVTSGYADEGTLNQHVANIR